MPTDPREELDLFAPADVRDREAVERLIRYRAELSQACQAWRNRRDPADEALSEDDLRRLRSLGYIDGAPPPS